MRALIFRRMASGWSDWSGCSLVLCLKAPVVCAFQEEVLVAATAELRHCPRGRSRTRKSRDQGPVRPG
jgi:hypothetical protein